MKNNVTPKPNKRVLLGMSGGVDSSVAAYLLKQDGYEVVGVTLLLWHNEAEAADAAAVCNRLGIDHHTIDLSDYFYSSVVNDFIAEYTAGRTPNPCAVCNRCVKFGEMFEIANGLDCYYIATGHYAQRGSSPQIGELLMRSKNEAKDQSYFLSCIKYEQLKRILFPVSGRDKGELRNIAERIELSVSRKKDSQDICFIPNGDYTTFLEEQIGASTPGDFVDEQGVILGKHLGISHYTIGQRKGLGISANRPLYVVDIDAQKNRVIVGDQESLYGCEVTLEGFNTVCRDVTQFLDDYNIGRFLVKIRYAAKAAPAVCHFCEQSNTESENSFSIVKVEFEQPQRAITPGQTAVLYDINNEFVIGGGKIISRS